MMRSPLKMQIGIMFLTLVNMIPSIEADGAWWLFGLAFFCAMLGLALHTPDGGSRMPSAVVLLGVFAAVCLSAVEMFQPQTVYILDLAHFIILLACCKFFELRGHRDHALVLLICFLLLVIGAFVSASPSFGILILIDATFGLAWVMRFQSEREMAGVWERRREALAFTHGGASVESPEMELSAPPASWKSTGLTAFLMLLIAAITFIAVPRGWGRGIFGRIQNVVPVAVTAFTEDMALRDVRIVEDPTLVMRARFIRNGRPFGGEDFQPYLRGATHDKYRDGRWRRTQERAITEVATRRDDMLRLLPNVPAPIHGDQIVEQDIWLESVQQGALFSLYPPISVASRDLRGVQQRTSDLTISTEDVLHAGISYRATSLLPGKSEFNRIPDAPPARRDWSGGFSRIHPAIRQFAREYFRQFGDFTDPDQREKIAESVCAFLRSGDYEYSLDRGITPDDIDRAKDFIFDNRRGHCEFFATAMALLLQSMDIPARTVNGFYGGEYNPVGGFYQFRARDAHAWVEVFLPPRGWVVYDPSPPTVSREERRSDGLLSRIRRLSDYMRFKWATSVVSFDTSSRRTLFETFEGWMRLFSDIRRRPGSLMESISALLWGPEMIPLTQRICYWFLLFLFVAFILVLGRLLWVGSLMLREYLPGGSRTGRAFVRRPEAKFYDRLLLLLSNRGHIKPRHLTPREFAAELAASHNDFADIPEFTEWYYEAQYSGKGLRADQWERLKLTLARLREDTGFGER